MLLISDENIFLYKHVPKTGVTPITTALLPYAEYATTEQSNLKDIKESLIYGKLKVELIKDGSLTETETWIQVYEKDFHDLNKFAFIRNPWSREVARYLHAINAPNHTRHQHATKGFDYWINWVCENDTQLQVDMLCDDSGHLLVDYLGRFENLQKDFDSICDVIGLPQHNIQTTELNNTIDYRSFYSEHTRRLISKTFIKDIERFEYEF